MVTGKDKSEEESNSLWSVRKRKETALARLRELEVDLREGKLVSTRVVELEWAATIQAAKAKLLNLGSKIGPIVIQAKTIAEAKAVIDDSIRQVLIELSSQDEPNGQSATRRGKTGMGTTAGLDSKPVGRRLSAAESRV
jgi:hypothetical protein